MPDYPTSHVIMIPQDRWVRAICISLVGGFLGGLAAALQDELDMSRRSQTSIIQRQYILRLAEHLIGRGCVGAVTGVGGLFAVLLSPITASFGDGAFWAFLMGASTLFGVFATRLLPAIERSFNRRLGFIEEEIGKVQIEVESNSGLDRAERALDDALSSWAVKSDIMRHADIADEYLKKSPRVRRVNIRFARVHFEKLKDKPGAISAATRFIDYLSNLPADSRDAEYKADLADSLYNRACYRVSFPGKDSILDEDYQPQLNDVELGLADLKRSFELLPANMSDAKEDIYFAWVRQNSPAFKELIK